VIGSVGAGTKLPDPRHVPYAGCATPTKEQCEAMIEGGVDAVLVETAQDLLQVRPPVGRGAAGRCAPRGRRVVISRR
jgi:5-methyltetrahydrofolate--homocysteine methyltransferase